MKNQNELVLEIMSMCLEYNCDTLRVFCDYAGHVNNIDIRVIMGGYDKGKDYFYQNTVRLNYSDSPGYLQLIIDELKGVKSDHDLSYAPEYIESTKERERLEKIANLQKQIDALTP